LHAVGQRGNPAIVSELPRCGQGLHTADRSQGDRVDRRGDRPDRFAGYFRGRPGKTAESCVVEVPRGGAMAGEITADGEIVRTAG
jgi:hypothetical protein